MPEPDSGGERLAPTAPFFPLETPPEAPAVTERQPASETIDKDSWRRALVERYGPDFDKVPAEYTYSQAPEKLQAASKEGDRLSDLLIYNNEIRNEAGHLIAEVIARGGHIGVGYGDITNLKPANDKYDRWKFGDPVISANVARATKEIKSLDLRAQVLFFKPPLGSDEYIMLFLDTTPEDDQKIKEAMMKLNQPDEPLKIKDKDNRDRPYAISSANAYLSSRDLEAGGVQDIDEARDEYSRAKELIKPFGDESSTHFSLRKIFDKMIEWGDRAVHRIKETTEREFPIDDTEIASRSPNELEEIIVRELGGMRVTDETLRRIFQLALRKGREELGLK